MAAQPQTVLGSEKTGLDKQSGELVEAAARGQAPTPLKKDLAAPRAATLRSTANDFWIGCRGAWHMTGSSGKGIYVWGGQRWDTNWSFQDDLPVGARQGWTYKENGYEFYMFFSRSGGQGACSGDRPYELLYSHDNANFEHFDCTI